MVEIVKNTLDTNQNLTPEMKGILLEFTNVFNRDFPDVDLTNLNERLATLQIREESGLLQKRPCVYNAYHNDISINAPLLDDKDSMHWLMHSFISIITSKDNYHGFDNENREFYALNEGYTEMITNLLVGEEQQTFDTNDNNYFSEQIVFLGLVGELIGDDKLYEAYFNNKPEVIQTVVNSELSDILNRNLACLDHNQSYDPFLATTMLIEENPILVDYIYEVPLNEAYFPGIVSTENLTEYIEKLSKIKNNPMPVHEMDKMDLENKKIY